MKDRNFIFSRLTSKSINLIAKANLYFFYHVHYVEIVIQNVFYCLGFTHAVIYLF